MNPTTTFRIAITDGFLVFTSWVIFYFLRFNSLPSFSRGPTVVIISWLSIHYILGTYRDLSIKQLNFSRYMINNFLASSLILALTFIYKKTNEGHITSTIGLDFIPKVLVLAMLAGQILLFIQKLEHLWSPQQNWLLITDPIERKIIAAEIEEDGCSIPCNIEWRSSYGLASLPKELALLLRLNGVAIGDEQKISKQDKLTLQHWQSNGIRILSLASWCDKFLERIAPSLVTESWSIRTEVLGILQSGASLRIKRFLDIFMSLAFTFISFPIILGLLCLHVFGHKVRITSNECIGLNGNPFQSLKLDAINLNSQNRSNQIIKYLGIHWLPQLWNILNGRMSFVGPRPRSIPEYKELLQKYPEAEIITSLRPGIASWYGIKNGSYKNEDLIYRELTRDLYYTRKHHLGIDMQIIAKLALNSIKLK